MTETHATEAKLRYAIIDGLIEANLRETRMAREAVIDGWRAHGNRNRDDSTAHAADGASNIV